MFYEKIDLYDYFSIPREGRTGGYLTVYARRKYTEVPEKKRPAMLVVPGGGYYMVSEREGEPIALHFVMAGYAAFELLYTIQTPFPVPFLEAAMAMIFIRENAEKYGVDPTHVGAVGFSAGGHLTGTLATLFDDDSAKKAFGKRAEMIRPDAVILSYPVLSTGEFGHDQTAEIISGGDKKLRKKLSIETQVTKNSSPAFIWHTATDDAVPVENSLMMASAYRKNGVPFELHIFERGRHGLSDIGPEICEPEIGPDVSRGGVWVELALSFLAMHGFEVKA